MHRFWIWGAIAVGAWSLAVQAEAFTSIPGKKVTVSASASGVTPVTTLTTTIVKQLTGAASALAFEGSGNDFRNSGEALQVGVSTNVAGNRLIIYTDNFAGNPAPCFDSANNNPALGPVGNDGGGLVGIKIDTNDKVSCQNTVPMIWALGVTGLQPTSDPKVFTGTASNVNYTFNPAAIPGVGASNGVLITDRAHKLTFTAAVGAPQNGTLDNQDLVFCSGGALGDARFLANNDGLFPQFFGEDLKNSDLCSTASTDPKDVVSQELSKNIAVVGFNFSGTSGLVPNLATAASDDVVQVSSPLFIPLGADFRFAPPGNYATSTLTVELVTQ